MYDARAHLTPATELKRLANVLGSLLRKGHFKPNSGLRKKFRDITDEQVMSRDPGILTFTSKYSIQDADISAIANRLPIFFGAPGNLFNPNSVGGHGAWKRLKDLEYSTGIRNPEYGYADTPIRSLVDFEEDPGKKQHRQAGKL